MVAEGSSRASTSASSLATVRNDGLRVHDDSVDTYQAWHTYFRAAARRRKLIDVYDAKDALVLPSPPANRGQQAPAKPQGVSVGDVYDERCRQLRAEHAARRLEATDTLIASLGPESLQLISGMDESNPAGMYTRVKQRFEGTNRARIRSLRQQLTHVRMEATEDVSTYVNRVKSIVRQLKDGNENISDGAMVDFIISGLDDAYHGVIDTMTATNADPTLDQLLGILIEHQSNLKARQNLEYNVAGAAKYKVGNQRPHHWSGAPPPQSQTGDSNKKCYNFGGKGHISTVCPSAKGVLDEAAAVALKVSDLESELSNARAALAKFEPEPVTRWDDDGVNW